jgi:hypothetical protein
MKEAKIPESEKIRHPHVYLMAHVSFESLKFGSTAGLIISPALYYFFKFPIFNTGKQFEFL